MTRTISTLDPLSPTEGYGDCRTTTAEKLASSESRRRGSRCNKLSTHQVTAITCKLRQDETPILEL